MRQRLFASAVIVIVALSILFNFYLILLSGSTAIADSRPGMSSSIVVGSAAGTLNATATAHAAAIASAAATGTAGDAVHANDSPVWLSLLTSALSGLAGGLLTFIAAIYNSKSTKKILEKELKKVVNTLNEQKIVSAIRLYEDNLRQVLLQEVKNECLDRLQRNTDLEVRGLTLPSVMQLHIPTRISNVVYSTTAKDSYIGYDPVALIRFEQRRLEQRIEYGMQELNIDRPDDNPRNPTNKYLMLGDPLGGKTTMLKYLILHTLERGSFFADIPIFPIPIYVDLQEFAKSEELKPVDKTTYQDLLNFVVSKWKQTSHFPDSKDSKQDILLTYLKKEIDAGHVRLFLDKLDESSMGQERYIQVIAAIKKLSRNYAEKLFIVVAARKIHYRRQETLQTTLDFRRWELEGFCVEDIEAFIESWFAATVPDTNKLFPAKKRAEQLIAILDKFPRLQALAANPLLLTYLISAWNSPKRNELFLSKNHIKLYGNCVDILIQKSNFSNDVYKLLNAVAWFLHKHYTYTFTHEFNKKDFLEQVFSCPGLQNIATSSNTIENWTVLLDNLISQTGIFKECTKNTYSFSCIAIQEYLAANSYVTTPHDQRATLDWSPESSYKVLWWEEVVRYCVMMEKDTPEWQTLKQQFVNDIASYDPTATQNDEFHTELIVKSQAVVVCPNTRSHDHLFETVKKQLLKALLTEEHLFAQELLLHVLVELEAPSVETGWLMSEILEPLKNQGNNENGKRIMRAYEIVKDFEYPDVFPEWLFLFANSDIEKEKIKDFIKDHITHQVTQSSAFKNLPEHEKVITALIKALLENTRSKEQRMYNVYTIGLLRGLYPLTSLLAYLETEQDPLVGWTIAYAIGMSGTRTDEVVNSLFDLLERRSFDLSIRWSAANALAMLAGRGRRSIIKHLEKVFNNLYESSMMNPLDDDDDKQIMWQIILALYNLNALDIIKELVVKLVPQQKFIAQVGRGRIFASAINSWINLNGTVPIPGTPDPALPLLEEFNGGQLEAKHILLLDVLGQLANTQDTIDKLRELQNNRANHDVYTQSFYRARWMIDHRKRSREQVAP